MLSIQKKLRLMACLLSLALTLVGCKSVYVPSLHQMPLMSEGDETQVSLGIGTNGYGLQLAYSPYYHWFVSGNGAMFSILQDTATDMQYKQRQGELATGFYTRTSKYGRLELSTGIGAGGAGLGDNRDLYRKAFVQPGFGVSTRIIDAGICTRFTVANQYLRRVNGTETKMSDTGFFFEPGFVMRVGYEQVKFGVQGGFSLPIANPGFTFERGYFGLSLHLTFVKDYAKYSW